MDDQKQHRDDLLIGENEWITFVHHDWANEGVQFADDLLQRLEPLFVCLEINCVAECCGFEAFSFTRKDILAIVPKIDAKAIEEALENTIQKLEAFPNDVLASKRLNNCFDRNTMLNLLRHILDTIRNVVARPEVKTAG